MNDLGYIPYDQEEAIHFENEMEKNMLYRSTDNFITLYNNNLIVKSNEQIDSVAKQITETYKNISLSNRKFIVKSNEEVISDEFIALFPHIAFVATLKRIVNDIFKDNYPEDTLLIFSDNNSSIQLYDYDKIVEYEGAEKIKNLNKSIATNLFIINNVDLQPFGEDGESLAIKAKDILMLDTSFIDEIGDLLQTYLKQN